MLKDLHYSVLKLHQDGTIKTTVLDYRTKARLEACGQMTFNHA